MNDDSPTASSLQDESPISPVFDNRGIIGPLEDQITQLQDDLKRAQFELDLLHRRDESLNQYMSKMDEDLRMAARLQRDFLPKQLPQVGRLRFHALYRPADYVSGDLYDVMRLDERNVGFYIADAVGHGIAAALLTMYVRNSLQPKLITDEGYRLLMPGEAMTRLNSTIIEQNLSHAMFATAMYGMINGQTLEMRFARAGHPSPILLRPGQPPQVLDVDGMLLGIIPDQQFETSTVQLEPGDRLFIYTDGIEMAFSTEEVVDTNQWRAELERRLSLSTPDLLADLVQHFDSAVGSIAPKDDLTIIVAEVMK